MRKSIYTYQDDIDILDERKIQMSECWEKKEYIMEPA